VPAPSRLSGPRRAGCEGGGPRHALIDLGLALDTQNMSESASLSSSASSVLLVDGTTSGFSLCDLLLKQGLITRQQVEVAVERQRRSGQRAADALVATGAVSADAVLACLGTHLGISSTRINVYTVDPLALKVLPEKVARRHVAFPLLKIDGELLVAIAAPKDLTALDDLRFAAGCRIKLVAALEEEIRVALDRYYGEEAWDPKLAESDDPVVIELEPADRDVRDEEAERSAVPVVERIIARAVTEGASDIHLDPSPSALRVRVRVDGDFHELTSMSVAVAPAILSRIKVLGGMDISERRLPQDGRFSATVGERKVDLRTATYPTVYGERAVLRILNQSGTRFDLSSVGMPDATMHHYRELARRVEGIILVTGPTGSGKTSTLYATLTEAVEANKNILTIENPVEYAIAGISQGQTNDKAGFTFAQGLRAILRQDPDIIMVGEIRDAETMHTAIEASLTGHLVLSTLHTNSAVGAVARLQEMGLEPYLLASSVLAVVSQRLVRGICQMCKKSFPRSAAAAVAFPQLPETLWRGIGCKECRGTGYKGRVALFELVRMTDELRDLILTRASEAKLLQSAMRAGTRTLREEGFARVIAGETTFEEIIRVTQERT